MTFEETAKSLCVIRIHQGINRGWAEFPDAEKAKAFHTEMWKNVTEWRDVPQPLIKDSTTVHWS